jgi:hypothetical protein
MSKRYSSSEVRPWRVRTKDGEFDQVIKTVNKSMVRIICMHDYPKTWRKRLIITPLKTTKMLAEERKKNQRVIRYLPH